MRVWTSVAAGVISLGSLVCIAPARADLGVTCLKSGSTLNITVSGGAPQVELLKSAEGKIFVLLGNYSPGCWDSNYGQYDEGSLGHIDLFQNDTTATRWVVTESDWKPTITIHNDAADEIMLTGSPSDETWDAVSPTSLSWGGRTDDPELMFDVVPTRFLARPGGGNDTVRLSTSSGAFTGFDDLQGGDGNDMLVGGSATDRIDPGNGADTADGAAGDDDLYVASDAEPDTVRPGEGYDELFLSSDDFLKGALVDPVVSGGDGVLRNDDYADFDLVHGTDGPDRFVAPPSGMVAIGQGGDDTYVSGPGDDHFTGDWYSGDTVSFERSASPVVVRPLSWPEDTVNGDGQDHLIGMSEIIGSQYADDIDTVSAFMVKPGLGDDRVAFSGSGGGTIFSEAGPDGDDVLAASDSPVSWDYSARTAPLRLSADGVANDGLSGEHDNIAGAPKMSLFGGAGADVIVGDSQANSVVGGPGPDVIRGGAGDDWVSGGNGADQLQGGAGNDIVDGDTGNDVLIEGPGGSNGADQLNGWDGRDTITYAGRSSAVSVTLDSKNNDGASDEGDAVSNLEIVVGTSYGDHLSGGKGPQVLRGGAGLDVLSGGADDDSLMGGPGADRLYGGAGHDVLSGGEGRDRFWAIDSLVDRLLGGTDIDLARRDSIDLVRSIEGSF